MIKFMKKLIKLVIKTAAVCGTIAAAVALLQKYVKIQSTCSCKQPENEDPASEASEDENMQKEAPSAEEAADDEDEADAISSDEATDSSSRRYISIRVRGKNSGVNIDIDKEQIKNDAAKLKESAAHITKSLISGSHAISEELEEAIETVKEEFTNEDEEACAAEPAGEDTQEEACADPVDSSIHL